MVAKPERQLRIVGEETRPEPKAVPQIVPEGRRLFDVWQSTVHQILNEVNVSGINTPAYNEQKKRLEAIVLDGMSQALGINLVYSDRYVPYEELDSTEPERDSGV